MILLLIQNSGKNVCQGAAFDGLSKAANNRNSFPIIFKAIREYYPELGEKAGEAESKRELFSGRCSSVHSHRVSDEI